MTPFTPHPDPITGAELQTLREACNLTREELGELAGVAARTVKHWESGRAGVPADVAALVRSIDKKINVCVNDAAAKIIAGIRHYGFSENSPVLVRYKSDEDLKAFGGSSFLGLSPHGAMIQRLSRVLAREPIIKSVRIVWFDRTRYLNWNDLDGKEHLDFESFRLEPVENWAERQVPTQAIPHRADQPPA